MKIAITHTSGPRADSRRSFPGVRAIRLGRRPDNDLVFDADEDATVSGHHAEIRATDEEIHIVDLDSTNGTWVNGERTTARPLSAEDRIRLGTAGGPELRVEREAPEEKKFGQRTVGMMIQQALAQAGLLRPSGASKSTDYYMALVERKIRGTSSRLKWILAASLALIVTAGIASSWYFWNRPGALIGKYGQGEAAGGGIAASNRHAVFLLAGSRLPVPGSVHDLTGFCTAFAIGPDLLATNAHCVQSAGGYAGIYALMNGVQGAIYPVTKLVAHPDYRPGELSPDVGLVRVAAHLGHRVAMADRSELALVAPGVPVFLYGFPGRLSNVEAPEATFIKGDIGRVTGIDQRPGDFERNTLLQHSAFSAGGTSGSPMFSATGRVIGINAGGYVEDGRLLAGYNFGMRIDLLHSLYPLMAGTP